MDPLANEAYWSVVIRPIRAKADTRHDGPPEGGHDVPSNRSGGDADTDAGAFEDVERLLNLLGRMRG